MCRIDISDFTQFLDVIQNIAIMVTDGVSNVNQANTVSEARRIRDENVAIVGIGVGLDEVTELQVCKIFDRPVF